MYSIDEIKNFINLLEESSLAVLELQKEDGSRVRLEKSQAAQKTIAVPTIAAPAMATVNNTASVQSAPVQSSPAPQTTDNGKAIKAPIVGVFYAAPSPESKAYVSVGSQVKKGDTVCIIEAMKCMNEIQAEESGEITEILAKDGDLVEYGQPLFRIK